MGLLEKLESSHMVHTLELCPPECLEFGRLDSGRLVLGQKNAWTQKIKICILPSKLQLLIMISAARRRSLKNLRWKFHKIHKKKPAPELLF